MREAYLTTQQKASTFKFFLHRAFFADTHSLNSWEVAELLLVAKKLVGQKI